MIISTKKGTPKEELEKIVDRFEKQGLDVTLITGKDYNVFGLVGDTTKIDERDVLANPWIDNVTRVSAPYKRANRLFHPADSVIDCGGVKIGGKEKIAPYILQTFPAKLAQYVEPFGGSGAVLLALPQDPSRLDIYNDLDAELVNLYSCIKECSNVLLRELKFLPIHSRRLFEYYRDFVAHKEVYYQNVQAEIACLGDRSCFTEEQAGELLPIFQERLALFDVKRAAAYYLAIRGSFSATVTSFGVKGMDVENLLKLFPPVSARLKDVPLENKNALQLIRERDREDGLIYADPPYVKTERIYRIVGKTRRFRKFHVRLWQVLSACKGYVVLSYNDCPFIRKLYRDWYILSFQRGNPLSQKKGASFGELIITNYDPRPYMTRQLNLFDESLGEWELKLVHIPNHPPRRKESPAGCRASNQNLLQ